MSAAHIILEEIALDGLDGVTVEGLWFRLERTTPKFPIKLDPKSKAYLWKNVIIKLKDVDFYVLKEPRDALRDQVRDPYLDGELELYHPDRILTITPCQFITDRSVRGSCSTYHSRTRITKQIRDKAHTLSLDEVTERWGHHLVMVASQTTREKYLLQDAADPEHVLNKINIELYCNLEHIAKGRRDGVYGSDAISFLQQPKGSKVTHGLMGYFRKKLGDFNLIIKQTYPLMKSTGTQPRLINDNVCWLRRFYKPRNSPHRNIQIRVEQFLMDKPGKKYFLVDLCQELKLNKKRVHKFLKNRTDCFDFDYVKVTEGNRSDHAIITGTVGEEEAPDEASRDGEPDAASRDEINATQVDENSQPTDADMSMGESLMESSMVCSDNMTTPLEQDETVVHGFNPDASLGASSNQADVSDKKSEDMKQVPVKKPVKRAQIDTSKRPPAKKQKQITRNHLVLILKMTLDEYETQQQIEAEAAEAEDAKTSTEVVRREIFTPMLNQISRWIYSLGPEGATRNMMRDAFNLHSLQARQMMKHMHNCNCFHFFYVDNKRQKVERVCSQQYAEYHQQKSAIKKVTPKGAAGSSKAAVTPAASVRPLPHISSETSVMSALGTDSPLSSAPGTPAPSTPVPGTPVRAVMEESTPEVSRKSKNKKKRYEKTPLGKQITGRAMERNQLITQIASQYQLILAPDLYKLVLAAEEEKYESKMDRKTLKRLCETLNRAGSIRIFKTTVQVETRSRDLFYVCEPSMTLENPLMRSSLEAQRSELTASINSNKMTLIKEESKEAAKAEKAKAEKLETEKVDPMLDYRYDTTVSVAKYGYSARLKRSETLHRFLCYMVYNYEGDRAVEEERDATGNVISAEGDINKLKVFLDQRNWKRFIPPDCLGSSTEHHKDGVAFLMDLGSQLPLCLFLTLIKVTYFVPAILEYLDDPLRRLIPVKHLPLSMQAPMLYKRKYLTSLRDTVTLLIMMGLATNLGSAQGGVTYRDNSVIYLHKIGCFVDTTDTLNALEDTTEEERLAKTIKFDMNKGNEDVEEFWISLRNICTGTLVSRKGRTDERPDVYRKDILTREIISKPMDEITEGVIPGDGLGAGGLDTMFYSHLNRQWCSFLEKAIPSRFRGQAAQTPDPAIKHKPCTSVGNLNMLRITPRVVKPTIGPITKPSSKSRSLAVSMSESKKGPDLRNVLIGKKRECADQRSAAMKRSLTETQRWNLAEDKRKQASVKKKQKYEARRAKDDKDHEAVSHRHTLRSHFSPQEDEALVLARIGLNILGCKDVATKPVRDFLHRCLPDISADKSSAACWARMMRLLQFGRKDRTVHLYTSIAMNDPAIRKYSDREPLPDSPTFSSTYADVMELLLKRCGSASQNEMTVDLSSMNGLEEVLSKYNLIDVAEEKQITRVTTGHTNMHPVSPPVENEWPAPQTDADIAAYTLTNFTISYLLVNDKVNRTYQMHKVYEQYPSSTTDTVLKGLQQKKIATLKKPKSGPIVRKFTLSYRYRLFTDRLQVIGIENFVSCTDCISELYNSAGDGVIYSDDADVGTEWRGRLISLLTLSPTGAINIDFELPEKVLDTSGLTQSDDEEDDDDEDDGVNDSRPEDSRDRKQRMKFEHCQIRPCTIIAKLNIQALPKCLKSTKKEDRQYIRTLMSSYPYDINTEEMFGEIKDNSDSDVDLLRLIYDSIDSSGITGIVLDNLYPPLTESHPDVTRSMLSCLVDELISYGLVISAGIHACSYVSHNNARVWLIHALKDTKGRGTGMELDDKDKLKITGESSVPDTTKQKPKLSDMSKDKLTNKKPSSTFCRVDIMPRPWLTPEGTINYQILYQLLTSAISTINKKQSMTFTEIHRLFSMVYSPVTLQDILNILEHIGCVKCDYLTPTSTKQPTLFSRRSGYTMTDMWVNSNSIKHYTVTHEAMQRISLFILNTRQGHDVIPAVTDDIIAPASPEPIIEEEEEPGDGSQPSTSASVS